MIELLTNVNFLVKCAWTFLMGIFGAGIFIYITSVWLPHVKGQNFYVSELSNTSKWIHVMIGGIVPMILSFSQGADTVYQSPVFFIQGACWPAIFLGFVEGFELISTKSRLGATKENMDQNPWLYLYNFYLPMCYFH